MSRVQGVALVVVAAVAVVALVGYILLDISGGGLGGAGGSGNPGGGNEAGNGGGGQEATEESDNDITGDWYLSLPVDEESDFYEEGDEKALGLTFTLERDADGALVGSGCGLYEGGWYTDLEVNGSEDSNGGVYLEVADSGAGTSEAPGIGIEARVTGDGSMEGEAAGYLNENDDTPPVVSDIGMSVRTPNNCDEVAGGATSESGGDSESGGGGVEGEWVLTLPLDTDSGKYEAGEPETVEVMVEFGRSESGELFGTANSEYAYDSYSNLEVNEIIEVDGKTSFVIEGWDDDDDESGSDYMEIEFYDESESLGELSGNAEGEVGRADPDVAGSFEGERQ